MEEIQSAVALGERPSYESPSGPAFPPPAGPLLYSPGDFYAPIPVPTPKRRRNRAAIAAIIALVMGAATVVGVLESRRDGGSRSATTTPTAITTPTTAAAEEPLPTVPAASSTNSTTLDTDAIVALVDPAVVDINTTIDGGEAAGTGMVLTSSGLVLTNNHVINGATTIKVQIAGTGPIYTAHVVGYDVTDDIGLIQIENVSGLTTTITVGDGSALAVGDTVVAIGNALGSSGPHAVSTGSLLALNQTITANDLIGGSESLGGLIQFDATIQPGDSGGPLVNASGQVVGMNTAASVDGRRRLSSSTGYAIPIATALDIAQQIEDDKASATVHIGDRAILGVEITSTRSSSQAGARVSAVASNSPAAEAGIVAGDTITMIDDTTITSVDDVATALFSKSPGDHVQVTWIDAEGTSHTATAQLIVGAPA